METDLLFFTRGQQTEKTWCYDLSHIEIKKNNLLNASHFDEFFSLLQSRGESENSWTVTRTEIEAKNYDLKAVNTNRKEEVDTRTPEELLDIIEKKGGEIQEALAMLRKPTINYS